SLCLVRLPSSLTTFPYTTLFRSVLSLLPVSSVAIDLVNGLIVSFIPPRTLPKLDLENGVPQEYRTMVVIPALLATGRDVAFLVGDRKSTRLNSSHVKTSYAVFCL